jgi:putative membrane protein
MMTWYGGFGWPMMFGMWLGITLWILLVAGLIWGLISWLGGRSRPPSGQRGYPGGPAALEILQQRYARGEIDHATYEQMRERLQASTPTGPPTYTPPR